MPVHRNNKFSKDHGVGELGAKWFLALKRKMRSRRRAARSHRQHMRRKGP